MCGCLSVRSYPQLLFEFFCLFFRKLRAFLCSTGDHLFNSLLCSCSVDCAVAAGNNIALVKVQQIRFSFSNFNCSLAFNCLCVFLRAPSAHSIEMFEWPRTLLSARCMALYSMFVCARVSVWMFSFLYCSLSVLSSLFCAHITRSDNVCEIVFFFSLSRCILLFVYASCSYLPSPYLTPSMPLEPTEQTAKISATSIDGFINSCPLICLATATCCFYIFRKISSDTLSPSTRCVAIAKP